MNELELLAEILAVLQRIERMTKFTMMAEVGDPDAPPREPDPDDVPPRE